LEGIRFGTYQPGTVCGLRDGFTIPLL